MECLKHHVCIYAQTLSVHVFPGLLPPSPFFQKVIMKVCVQGRKSFQHQVKVGLKLCFLCLLQHCT